MSVIHFVRKYLFNRIVLSAVAVGLVIANIALGIGVFASYGGGSPMGGVGFNSGPGYEFDGIYTISQDYSELVPDDDGVYVISDYTSAPILWIDRTKVNDGNAFYVTQTRKVYDDTGTEIPELSVGTGHVSNYRPYSQFETSYLRMEYGGKYTEFNTVLSDVVGSSPGENVFYEMTIRFAYADYDPDAIPSVTITDVRQAGEHISATYQNMGGEWYIEYNNRLDVEVDYRADNLLPGMVLSLNNDGRKISVDGANPTSTVKYNAGYYPQKFSTNFSAFNSLPHIYQEHSNIGFSSISNNDTPYFSMYIVNTETGERVGSDSSNYMSIDELDAEENLGIKIEGYNYQQDTDYEIGLSYSGPFGEPILQTVSKTGAEINSGVVIPYDQTVEPITIQDLLERPLNGSGYEFDVACNIGYATKTIHFWRNSNAWASADMFNANGESFLQHFYSGASGDAGIIDGAVNNVFVSPDLITSKLYFGFEISGGESNTYDYYLFRSENTDNDFYQKTLLGTGSIAVDTPTYIDVGGFPGSGTTYSVLFAHDGVVKFVQHFQVNVMDNNFHRAVAPLIFDVVSDIAPVYIRNATNFATNYNVPVDVKALLQTAKADETYQLKISGQGNVYEYEGEVSGAALDGSTTLLTVPAYSSSYEYDNKSYYFSVSQNGRLVAESILSIMYTNSDEVLSHDYIYTDLLNSAYAQIVDNPAADGSFAANLTAPETFENEFDVYLTVEDYDRIVGNCNGICGGVGELDYNHNQLELVSAEPLNGFEIEYGDRVVLYRATGVEEGTAIMKLRFRRLNMSVGDTATITFRNVEGSNGVVNIPTDQASVSTKYSVPFRFVESHVFNHEEYEINPGAGSAGDDGTTSGLIRPIWGSQIGSEGITIYYKGYEFDDGATYSYTLTNTTTNQNVSTGEVNGRAINQGAFNVRSVPFTTYADSDYELKIYDGDVLIYTHTDSFRMVAEPDLYINFGYGYNKAGIINGSYTIPYDSDATATVITDDVDDASSYRIEYNITNYGECEEGSAAEHYEMICAEDAAAQELSGAVSATGAELKAGVGIALPAAQPTTIRRKIVFSVKTSGGLSSQTIRSNMAYVNYIDSSSIVSNVSGHTVDSDMVLGKVNPSTTVASVLEDFTLANGYNVLAVGKDGNRLGQDATIGTGSKVVVRDNYGQTILEYMVKIKGDTSGDGKITVLDLVQAKRHLAGVSRLESIYAEAGDITNSKYIGITDVVKICRHVAGIEEVKQ